VHIHREVRNTAPSPLHQRLAMPPGEVDRWWTYDYTLPGILKLDSGVRPANGASGKQLHFHSCQAIVPESETTSHYFFMQAHDFDLDDARLTHSLYEGVLAAFHEDKAMIEAQARLIEESPPTQMIGLSMDAALTRYRRLYDAALAAEQASTTLAKD
jgi:vanillate O-demethylase monooxygenase subunit